MRHEKIKQLLDAAGVRVPSPMNSAMFKRIGSILDVDAVVFGEIERFSFQEEEELVKGAEPVWLGKYERDKEGNIISDVAADGRAVPRKILENKMVEKNRLIRYAVLEIRYRAAEAKQGTVIVAETESESESWTAVGGEEIARLPGKEAVFDLLVDRATKSFVRNVAPHPVLEDRELEQGGYFANGLGVELAKNNMWDEAMEKWMQATKVMPNETAAYYNLGVAFEHKGLFNLAYKAYQNALARNPRSARYVKAAADIQNLLEKLY
jgi:tetratricopeptide (TPR) repeat protein